jgi:ketosteroid isomerase-like protein
MHTSIRRTERDLTRALALFASQNLQKQLDAVIDLYCKSVKLFAKWQARGVTTAAAINEMLAGQSATRQLALLKEQIEMRVIGLGMTKFQAHYSSSKDESVGTKDDLMARLKEVIAEELTWRRRKELPTEAVAPLMKVSKAESVRPARALQPPTRALPSLGRDRIAIAIELHGLLARVC